MQSAYPLKVLAISTATEMPIWCFWVRCLGLGGKAQVTVVLGGKTGRFDTGTATQVPWAREWNQTFVSDYLGQPTGDGRTTNSRTIMTSLGDNSVQVLNYDGDGKDDILLTKAWVPTPFRGSIYSLNPAGDSLEFVTSFPTILGPPALPTEPSLWPAKAVGDVNGDGKDDILDVLYFRNLYGTYNHTSPLVGYENATPLGDVNNDGYDDFSLSTTTALEIYWGEADISNVIVSPDITITGAILSATAGDFDGDGVADLAVSSDDKRGEVRVFYSIASQPAAIDFNHHAPALSFNSQARAIHGVQFNGDDVVFLPNTALDGLSDFTFSFWLDLNVNNTGGTILDAVWADGILHHDFSLWQILRRYSSRFIQPPVAGGSPPQLLTVMHIISRSLLTA